MISNIKPIRDCQIMLLCWISCYKTLYKTQNLSQSRFILYKKKKLFNVTNAWYDCFLSQQLSQSFLSFPLNQNAQQYM